MAIEITSDTIVKILVRRGVEADRVQTVLTEGELGYSVDTRRLFVGDGSTLGGVPAGNIHLGFTTNRNAYSSYAQNGDQISDSGKNYVFQSGSWNSISPQLYLETTTNTQSIQEDQPSTNRLRLNPDSLGAGLSLDYSINPSGYLNNTIQKQYGLIQFDARYISLCASSNSFYIGNVFNKQINNNLNATLNVDRNIFVNDTNPNPFQIQIYAKDPNGTSNSYINAVSGGLVIRGQNSVGLLNNYNATISPQIQVANNGQVIFTPNIPNQSYGTPGNLLNGITRVLSTAYFDKDVLVAGTLTTSILCAYSTIVSETTALSVINSSNATETATIVNTNPNNAQNILRVSGNSGSGVTPYMIVKDSNTTSGPGVVAINVEPGSFDTYSLLLSGSLGVNSIGVPNGTDKAYIRSSDITLVGGSAGTGTVTVSGNLRTSQDIIAFSTSDISLKENIKPISNALIKLKKLNGVHFKWKDGTVYNGEDYGVIAQEVEHIMPEIVITRANGKKAVRYEKLIPLIIEAIKEIGDR